MKIRKGFVSNSSSSSYIVGIGIIEDKEKFLKYIEKYNIEIKENEYQYGIRKISEIKKKYDMRKNDNKLYVDNFIAESNTKYDNEEQEIFFVNITNNEGDGDFWNDDSEELNYDINLNFFEDDQQKLYKIFHDKESGLKNCDVTYGAARNG